MDDLKKNVNKSVIAPIYIKTSSEECWPEDSFFYILGSNGLFLCRNQEFFSSSIPMEGGPSVLQEQEAFLKILYPQLPRRLLEIAVGFFTVIYGIYGAEAAMLLIWNKTRRRYKLLVPEQRSIVFENLEGRIFPLSVHYELPNDIQADEYVIGDIHSHCNASAFSSLTDQNDEKHRTGLHIVVGRIKKEPPEFHIEAVIDGVRFNVKPEIILEGYKRRRKGIREEWVKKVQIETRKSVWISTDCKCNSNYENYRVDNKEHDSQR